MVGVDGDFLSLAQGGAEFEKKKEWKWNLYPGFPGEPCFWAVGHRQLHAQGPAGPIADLYTVGTASQCYGGE